MYNITVWHYSWQWLIHWSGFIFKLCAVMSFDMGLVHYQKGSCSRNQAPLWWCWDGKPLRTMTSCKVMQLMETSFLWVDSCCLGAESWKTEYLQGWAFRCSVSWVLLRLLLFISPHATSCAWSHQYDAITQVLLSRAEPMPGPCSWTSRSVG